MRLTQELLVYICETPEKVEELARYIAQSKQDEAEELSGGKAKGVGQPLR